MSDSSFIAVTRHRSLLSSSHLSSSSLPNGHNLCPNGRSPLLDVVDDEWAKDKLPLPDLETHHDSAFPTPESDVQSSGAGNTGNSRGTRKHAFGPVERAKEEKWTEIGIGWE
ncbi:hypothetical protein TrLO_g14696 [Triparma laevis f. longispina]|uniref:Anaphase-promoting complex subunit 13 n=1 Tax=Triparma laevis f. longispina TaxID=1714387 RepID=A0A9W7ABS0_9STRA|nr:hypothetical protein TrLO_g14696 [Triparma laevis f. longispina]